jgi:signal transduction histidine kinase
MRLVDYIDANLDRLVAEWVDFARTRLPAADHVGRSALENGSSELLRAIVADMASVQTLEEQKSKSRGDKDDSRGSQLIRIAREHADQRLKDGFSMAQLVSEYRALRASILRCWIEDCGAPDENTVDELIRFNEAMDQSLTEAVRWFNHGVEYARDIFVGVLGHDLRDPLNAASMAMELQKSGGANPKVQAEALRTAQKSIGRMAEMIDDLLVFARTRLGGPLEVEPVPMDLAALCHDMVEEMALSRPESEIRLNCSGELSGKWDAGRIKQVLANLIKNAFDYGKKGSPVSVSVEGEGDEVVISVHNEGNPIPFDRQHTLFDPLVRGAAAQTEGRRRSESLGLGLYIVKKVTESHGGTVSLQSAEKCGTTFKVRLPRIATAGNGE